MVRQGLLCVLLAGGIASNHGVAIAEPTDAAILDLFVEPPPEPAEAAPLEFVPAPGAFHLHDDRALADASARRAAADAAAAQRRKRAAFQAQQRALRREANAWLGVTPLRPTWPSTPSTHSYYQPRRIIYVPVHASSVPAGPAAASPDHRGDF